MLTQALGTKEHPGRTRGTGVVPEESHTYRSRSRGRVDQEAECLRRLKEMEDRMDAWIEATVEPRVQQFCCPRGQDYHKTLLLLPLAHSLGVVAAVD